MADCRTREEFENGRPPGAVHVPIYNAGPAGESLAGHTHAGCLSSHDMITEPAHVRRYDAE